MLAFLKYDVIGMDALTCCRQGRVTSIMDLDSAWLGSRRKRAISIMRFVASSGKQPRSVLDLGCAMGDMTLEFARTAQIAVGTDVNRDIITHAQGQHDLPVCFVAADAVHLPYRDRVFDAVITNYVIEHVPRSSRPLALKEIERVLAQDALCYMSTINPLFLAGRRILSRIVGRYFGRELPHVRAAYAQPELYPVLKKNLAKIFTVRDVTVDYAVSVPQLSVILRVVKRVNRFLYLHPLLTFCTSICSPSWIFLVKSVQRETISNKAFGISSRHESKGHGRIICPRGIGFS
jgi:ubiquinone/menaquinone biosynthesis C-methylase UbiE